MEPVLKPEKLAWPDGARLYGDHFIANILKAAEPHPQIVILDPDPRNQRMKPDAFPVVVEETGPTCELVRPGDRIVLERWQWAQHEIGEGRFVAREREVLVCENSVPAPGVIVVDVIDGERKPWGLALPQTYKPAARKYVHGRISRSAYSNFKVGWEIWFEKYEHGQYRFNDKIIWRVDETMALMVGMPAPILEVV
jgi:hypothetical protein